MPSVRPDEPLSHSLSYTGSSPCQAFTSIQLGTHYIHGQYWPLCLSHILTSHPSKYWSCSRLLNTSDWVRTGRCDPTLKPNDSMTRNMSQMTSHEEDFVEKFCIGYLKHSKWHVSCYQIAVEGIRCESLLVAFCLKPLATWNKFTF